MQTDCIAHTSHQVDNSDPPTPVPVMRPGKRRGVTYAAQAFVRFAVVMALTLRYHPMMVMTPFPQTGCSHQYAALFRSHPSIDCSIHPTLGDGMLRPRPAG